MTMYTRDWEEEDLERLERATGISSFALAEAWAEAASISQYAEPLRLALRKEGNVVAVVLGLRRTRARFSKIVCGTNGGIGILGEDQTATASLGSGLWPLWRPSILQLFAPNVLAQSKLHWQANYTFQIDLRNPLAHLRARLEKRTRNAIDRATRLGVRVVSATGGQVEQAFELLNRAADERNFALPPVEYLRAIHEVFQKREMSEIVLATLDSKLLAMVHVLGARSIASWWKGGASPDGYRLNATVLAQWRAIQLAREHGFRMYDFGGTHPTSPTYAGIHRFKASFGGRLVNGALGSRSTVVSRAVKKLFSV